MIFKSNVHRYLIVVFCYCFFTTRISPCACVCNVTRTNIYHLMFRPKQDDLIDDYLDQQRNIHVALHAMRWYDTFHLHSTFTHAPSPIPYNNDGIKRSTAAYRTNMSHVYFLFENRFGTSSSEPRGLPIIMLFCLAQENLCALKTGFRFVNNG